jgi:hypothetical protein
MYTGKLTTGHVVNSVAIPPAVLTTLVPKPGNGHNPTLTTYFPQVHHHFMLSCTSQPSKAAGFLAKTDTFDSRQVRFNECIGCRHN